DFGDRHGGGGRHHRIEVARGLPVDEIPETIALPGLDEREVGLERRFEDEGLAVDDAGLFTFGDKRPITGRRKEAADPGAAGPDPLGERPLRDELDLELPTQELALELLVLPHIRR